MLNLTNIPGLRGLPPAAVEIVFVLLGILIEMLRKGATDEAQEEALMQAQEEAKRLQDKRKFGRQG